MSDFKVVCSKSGLGVWIRCDMSDFKARLHEELGQLTLKTEKLKSFILRSDFESLPEIDRRDLKEQLHHMENYLSVLSKRVSRICN